MRHNLRLYACVPHFFALWYRVNTSYLPPGRLERLRGSPLQPFVERYVTQAAEQNYKPKTVIWHVQLFTRCSLWLHRTRRKLRDLNEKVVERFLVQELPRRESWAGAMPAFCRLLAILRVDGVVPAATCSSAWLRPTWGSPILP